MKETVTLAQVEDMLLAIRSKGTLHDSGVAFDYTQWQETLFQGMTIEEISRNAMEYRKKLEAQEVGAR